MLLSSLEDNNVRPQTDKGGSMGRPGLLKCSPWSIWCSELVDRGYWVGECEDALCAVVLALLVVMSSTYCWLRVGKGVVVLQCGNLDSQRRER